MTVLPHEKEIVEYINTIDHLKKKNEKGDLYTSEIERLEGKLGELKEGIYKSLSPWERVQICRHPKRPHSLDYIENICDSFTELCGDRYYADDQAIIGGLARIGDMKCVIIAQEKGSDTESRLKHNFGMPHPEGYRKALRLMKLAEKFHLPVVSLIDTAGANPTLGAEERGQGRAIAENLFEMSRLATPIIVLIIGEGCSGGALGTGIGDVVAMLEHSYYSVISPEGCASILWKDAGKKEDAAKILKLNAEYLLDQEVIDVIIKEPLGGAHHDKEKTYETVQQFLLQQWEVLKRISPTILLEDRYQKFRKIGAVQ